MKNPDSITRRLKPEERKELLLDVAIKLAGKLGLSNVTREQIAETAQVSPALVSARLGTMTVMRRTVMRQACKRGDTAECLSIVAQGLAARDSHALKASADLQRRALATLRA